MVAAISSCRCISQGIHAQKVDPEPGTEVHPISPPAPSMIALEIASPSPVPCANSLSFWKRPNNLFCSSLGMPTLESSTYMRMPSLSIEYPIFIYPDFVHFTALVRKFIHTCFKRFRSKNTQQSGPELSNRNSISGLVIFCRIMAYSSLAIFGMLNFSRLRSRIPASILERSRISLIRRNSNSLLD